MSIRIATWNLERPGSKERSWRKYPGQRDLMEEINADIWVITEGRRDYLPVDGFVGVHSPADENDRPEVECMSAVWVRSEARIVALDDPAPVARGSIAAHVTLPGFGALIVYASVLAYAAERRHIDGSPASKNWEVHYAEIERQSAEWAVLRDRYPDTPLVVAGDFNMNLAGPHWYGTSHGRTMLEKGLTDAELDCLTEVEGSTFEELSGQELIDHICVSPELEQVGQFTCRSGQPNGVRLSDHPAIAASVRRRDRPEAPSIAATP